jgi:predicted TIM-barrel fold metal-dependent hydrolase
MKRMTEGRMALWGGVNGFVTMERGTQQQVRTAVREAMQILGTDRFILSPVDNVTGDSDQVWRNVAALVETWKELRGVSWRRCQRGNYVQ